MEIAYKNFTVKTRLEAKPTKDNYFKQDIEIYRDEHYIATLWHPFLCLPTVEDVLSGDEERAIKSIRDYIKNMRSSIKWIEEKMEGIL